MSIRVAVTLCPHCGQPRNIRDLGREFFKEEDEGGEEDAKRDL